MVPSRSGGSAWNAKRYTGRALAAVMVAAPLLIGGAHPITQVGLSAAALLTAAAYLCRKHDLRLHAFAWVAVAGLLASMVQLVPLPAGLVRLLSPRAAEIRSEVAANAPSWMPLTLDVPATLLEICKGFGYVGLLVVASLFARRSHRARRLLTVLALFGGAFAALTFIQRAIHPEAILGVYRVQSMPGSGFFGTFVNGNHAASLFALTTLISAGLVLEVRRSYRVVLGASALLSASAVFVTSSRGGALGLLVGAFALAVVLFGRRFGRVQGLVLACALLALLGMGSLMAADDLRGRLMVNDASDLWQNQKARGWRDALELVADYSWTGVGRGAFEAPATAYRDTTESIRLVYPENIVLQMSAEWGVPVCLMLMALFGHAIYRTLRRAGQLEPSTLGAGCGVLAVLVHEMADFGLELPGVAIPTVVALAVVAGRTDERRSTRLPAERGAKPEPEASGWRVNRAVMGAAMATWLVALTAGAWAVPRTLWADGNRARQAVSARAPDAAAVVLAAQARHPADYYLELLTATEAMRKSDPRVMSHLNRALRLSPSEPHGHLMAARWLARHGRSAQAALEYRLATENGVGAAFPELFKATGRHVIEAVPQKPPELFSLAESLLSRGQAGLAKQASDRAVAIAGATEEVLSKRVQLAKSGGDKAMVIAAAESLLADDPSPAGFVTAIDALTSVGDADGARRALARGVAAHPRAGSLVIAGVRLRLTQGDVTGAHDLLATKSQIPFTLAERVEAENLAADLAEKNGDATGAIVARARAKMMFKQLHAGQTQANTGDSP